MPIGEPVDPERLAQIPEDEPLRLLRVEQELWDKAMSHNLPAPSVVEDDHTRIFGITTATPISLLPAPAGERKNDSTTEENNQIVHRGRRIPCVTATGSIGQAMACLEMLARWHNAPFAGM